MDHRQHRTTRTNGLYRHVRSGCNKDMKKRISIDINNHHQVPRSLHIMHETEGNQSQGQKVDIHVQQADMEDQSQGEDQDHDGNHAVNLENRHGPNLENDQSQADHSHATAEADPAVGQDVETAPLPPGDTDRVINEEPHRGIADVHSLEAVREEKDHLDTHGDDRLNEDRHTLETDLHARVAHASQDLVVHADTVPKTDNANDVHRLAIDDQDHYHVRHENNVLNKGYA